MSGFKKIISAFSYQKVFWGLFYLFIFCLLLNNSYKSLDPDLGWHLKVGEDIIREGSVPHLNYYNYTLEGKTWVDHEWLLNAFVYVVYTGFGNIGLNIIFALIIILTLAILHYSLKNQLSSRPSGVFFFIFFMILGVVAMSPHLGIRLQEIGLLFLTLTFLVISRFEVNKRFRVLFWLIPLFYLWAVAHASFLIGIFILFFWLGVKIAEKLIFENFDSSKLASVFRIDRPLSWKQALIFGVFSLISFIVTFATPYGFDLYANFVKDCFNTYYLTHISEWLPAWYFPLAYWQLVFMALAIASIILIWLNRTKEIMLKPWDTALIIFFVLASFKSKRHFPLLFVSIFPLIIKNYFNIFGLSAQKEFYDKANFLKLFIIITLILSSISLILKTNFTKDPFKNFCADYPCQAVNFLKGQPQYADYNILNEYGWGGYLIWTWPERKYFIDGRMPQYPFNGKSFLEEYMEFFDENKAKEKLDQHDIRLLLIKSNEEEYKFNWFEKFILRAKDHSNDRNYLKEFVSSSPDWGAVYSDPSAIIYAKK